jgi:hypothetical protein
MPLGETPSSRSVDSYVLARLAWRGLGGPTLVIPRAIAAAWSFASVRSFFVGVILRMWECEATAFQHAVRDQCGEQFYTDAAQSSDLSLETLGAYARAPVCVSPGPGAGPTHMVGAPFSCLRGTMSDNAQTALVLILLALVAFGGVLSLGF